MRADEERDIILKAMAFHGINVNQLRTESKHTGTQAFLAGGGITVDKLHDLKQALRLLIKDNKLESTLEG